MPRAILRSQRITLLRSVALTLALLSAPLANAQAPAPAAGSSPQMAAAQAGFEALPEAPDVTRACLDRLGELGDYRYNFVAGEGSELVFEEWTDGPSILAATLRRGRACRSLPANRVKSSRFALLIKQANMLRSLLASPTDHRRLSGYTANA